MHIGSIEKLQLTTTGSPLLIRCKTFLFVTFVIPREKECHDIYITLQKLYQPGMFNFKTRKKNQNKTFSPVCCILCVVCNVFTRTIYQ